MPFVGIGLVLLILKIAGIEPVSEWSWVWVLAPFGAAMAWWLYADTTGLTQKRAIRKMEERKVARRERDMEALGLNVRSDRTKRAAHQSATQAKADLQAKKDGGA
jgi:small Trp-rich protein